MIRRTKVADSKEASNARVEDNGHGAYVCQALTRTLDTLLTAQGVHDKEVRLTAVLQSIMAKVLYTSHAECVSAFTMAAHKAHELVSFFLCVVHKEVAGAVICNISFLIA